MRNKFVLILVLSILAMAGCNKNEEPKTASNSQTPNLNASPNARTVTVQEVLNVSSYTYLRVTEGSNELWIAIPKADVKVGAVLSFNNAMEMKNFESKELKKTFETILFVDNIDAELGKGSMTTPQKPVIEKENVNIEPVKGGVTIAQLYSKMNEYAGKTIKIKGKVVKFNSGIMNTNWVHIQDGTNKGEDFDLTITTNDKVTVGDIIVFEGKVSVNKDFGYGYSYKVIIENAKLTKGTSSI